MDLQRNFDTAHREHQEILEFLNLWENALKLLDRSDLDLRCEGLHQLQNMEERIASICDHCRREEEDPDSPLFRFAQEADRGRMKDEHFRLYRANYEFRRELEFTTSSYTEDLLILGQKLLVSLRGHITYEDGLLKRFEADQLYSLATAAHS
jgi:hypothetical protein